MKVSSITKYRSFVVPICTAWLISIAPLPARAAPKFPTKILQTPQQVRNAQPIDVVKSVMAEMRQPNFDPLKAGLKYGTPITKNYSWRRNPKDPDGGQWEVKPFNKCFDSIDLYEDTRWKETYYEINFVLTPRCMQKTSFKNVSKVFNINFMKIGLDKQGRYRGEYRYTHPDPDSKKAVIYAYRISKNKFKFDRRSIAITLKSNQKQSPTKGKYLTKIRAISIDNYRELNISDIVIEN